MIQPIGLAAAGFAPARAATLGLLLIAACQDRSPEPAAEPLRVLRVFPAAPTVGGSSTARVLLNQEITVYFNQLLDPLTVTPDTVRVVDQNGNRVPGRLRTGTRSVTFEPIPPVSPSLDDGSFRVDRTYRLEVAGLPLWNSIRARDGQHLDRRFDAEFRTVPMMPSALGFATPFLPVQAVSGPFALRPQKLYLLASSGRMELHFNAPILPTSVHPRGVLVFPLLGGARGSITKDDALRPLSVQVLPESRSPELHFGSTLEIRFDPADLDASQYMAILEQDGAGLRDYLDRPLTDSAGPHGVELSPDDQIELMSWGGGAIESWDLVPELAPDRIAFRLADDGSLEPLCLVEAGAGELGVLWPQESMTIRAGVPFDRGDGVEVVVPSGSRDFAFEQIEIPAGVEVRIESPELPIVVRCVGEARVAGKLVLDTPLSHGWREAGETTSFVAVRRRSGCTIVVGGNLRVPVGGSIEHLRENEPGSPLSLITGGTIWSRGRMPAEIVVEVAEGKIVGTLESAIPVHGRFDGLILAPIARRGIAPGRDRIAEQWTGWRRIPVHHSGEAVVQADGVHSAEVVLEVQTAPAHSVDPTRPDLSQSHRLQQPMRVDGPLELVPGDFLRFRIRAIVSPNHGGQLPSIRAIRVVRG